MNTKNSVASEVTTALQEYVKHNGLPEKILLEVSDKLEPVQLPEGMNVVVSSVRIPKNILLIGVDHEEEVCLDVEESY